MSRPIRDISKDFMLCDNLGTVTLKITGSADLSLPNCSLMRPHEYKELEPTGANVIRSGTVFMWPRNLSVEPPIGSIVLDANGVYWTVWKLLRKHYVDTWEPFCLNLNIVTAATNNATILKAVYTKGRANEAKATWKGFTSGVTGGNANDIVTARFQPSEEQARLEFGAESSAEVYRVYFEAPVPGELAGGEYRILDTANHRFRVLRYYNEQRIDRLPVAICTKITEGAEWASNPTDGP